MLEQREVGLYIVSRLAGARDETAYRATMPEAVRLTVFRNSQVLALHKKKKHTHPRGGYHI